MSLEDKDESRIGFSRRQMLGVACAAAPVAAGLFDAAPALARLVDEPPLDDDVRLMQFALTEAKAGDRPFGAVIVKNGKVLAKGRDLTKQLHDPTAHGEMTAIRDFMKSYAPEAFKGTTLYSSGEPCCMCMGAIVWCGISRLVYAASMADIAAVEGQILISSREVARKAPFTDVIISSGALRSEAVALLKKT